MSLVVMDDAVSEPSIEQPESGQKLIKQFFQLFMSGEIEHRLAEFTPNAQAHLIDEINEGIHLLEEFVAKYKTIEVTLVHWFMNPEQRSNYVQPHIRFWCRGQISVSARLRIDNILKSRPRDAQAMISEWVIE